jgi:hypothetical protein
VTGAPVVFQDAPSQQVSCVKGEDEQDRVGTWTRLPVWMSRPCRVGTKAAKGSKLKVLVSRQRNGNKATLR